VAHSLCIESGRLAHDLFALLQSIDPTRWKQDFEQAARARLARIRDELAAILDRHAPPLGDRRLTHLYERLQRLEALIERFWPRENLSAARLATEWQQLRERLQPAYHALARGLDGLAVPVPALRPTNYGRSLFHLAMGIGCVVLVHVLSEPVMVTTALGFALWCWIMEALRIHFKGVTRFYMWFLGRIAHPHEHYRVNSSTWYGSALAILALCFSPPVAAVGVIVLAVADPVAALVGRRYGRTRLRAGRTLEGTLAFVVSGALAALAVLLICYPSWPLAVQLAVAATGGLGGALVELASGRLDDNLTIPLGAAAGGAAALLAFGM